MSSPVKPIPDGYSVVSPYLVIRGAARALEFYREAFGATERMRLEMPGGKIGHAEIQLGASVVMLSDEFPEMGHVGPEPGKSAPVSLHLYVTDVDAVVARAAQLGAKVLRPVQNQFYGDRSGMLADPFGHVWTVATHVEDVSPGEIQRRAAQKPGGN